MGKPKMLLDLFDFELSIKPTTLNLAGLSDFMAFTTAIALASEPYTMVGVSFLESVEFMKFSNKNLIIILKKNKNVKDKTKLKIKPGNKYILSPKTK